MKYYTQHMIINFFNLNERKNKIIVKNISSSFNSFCMITKDLLLIPGYEFINIIKINDY